MFYWGNYRISNFIQQLFSLQFTQVFSGRVIHQPDRTEQHILGNHQCETSKRAAKQKDFEVTMELGMMKCTLHET